MVKSKNVATSKMAFAKDDLGKEVLLLNQIHPLVMEWEKPYRESSIEAIASAGDVLEIGFGLGHAANQIQKHHPKSHIILESDPTVAERAKQWAAKNKGANIKIIEGSWKDHLDKLGKFDAIYFDDYSPLDSDETNLAEFDPRELQSAVQESEALRKTLSNSLKQLRGVKFTDEQLHDFTRYALSRSDVTKDDIISFIDQLVTSKNITAAQKAMFLKEYEKSAKKKKSAKVSENNNLTETIARIIPVERFIAFAECVLKKHMRPGAKLSGYMGTSDSKKNNNLFKDKILSRKDVRYSEKAISVIVPDNCPYFEGNKALVIVVEKTK